MSAFRILTVEELELFKKEFIEFLVVNGIEGNDWTKINKDNPEQADEFIRLFSEVVFTGILRKVKFLDIFQKGSVKSFQCLPEKLILVAADYEGETIDSINDLAVSADIDIVIRQRDGSSIILARIQDAIDVQPEL